MEPILMVLGFMCVITIAIAIAVVSARKRALRREAMSRLASSLGLSFNPARDYDHDDRYAHMAMFRRGSRRYAYNTVMGRMSLGGHECGVIFGDFHYAVDRNHGEHRTKKSYRFSYLIIQLPWANVPDLLIRPEGMFDRIGALVGFEDIDFESEEFSRAFLVKSSDRKFAYDLIDPRMIEFLLQTRPQLIDLEHGSMGFSSGSGIWETGKFRNGLDWMEEFMSRWPKHMVRSLEG